MEVPADAAAGWPDPIALVVLTGFLGAGKTTLLNGLLRDPALADTVVIVNEFGEVGIDHLLVETVEDGMVLLSAGCLCCTVRGDLVNTLEDLLRRRDNDRLAPFRRVVIETTGLADPAPVLSAVLHHPYLRLRYVLQGVVTVVDAATGGATLDRHPEARRQVAIADRLVLTKTDLGEGAAARAAFEARLRLLNPSAAIVEARHGRIAVGSVLAAGPFTPDGKIDDVGAWLAAEAAGHEHGHPHGGNGHPHAHDPSRHDETIRSFVLTADRPIPEGQLDMFLEIVRATFGPRILRIKGLAELRERPGRPIVVHGVQHLLHVPASLPAWPDGDRRSRLVFIMDGVPKEPVQRLWNAFTGRPEIDRPDAAAITENPLAPPTLVR